MRPASAPEAAPRTPARPSRTLSGPRAPRARTIVAPLALAVLAIAAAPAVAAPVASILPTAPDELAAQTPPTRPAGAAAAARAGGGDPGRILGVVADEEGERLSAVAITLRSAADSALVTGTMTGADGRFRLEGLPLGSYRIHVGTLGFRPRSSDDIELTGETPEIDLGEIRLVRQAIELEGIDAQAERSPVVIEADRTVYDVRTMPVAATGNATDVLRTVPELEVDVNNNVRLAGNQAVAIHLNGRPTPLRGEQLVNFLEQLPGDRIARVEVMPNPSARHDPEGMGGIVNIVLRDDVELGLSGSATVNASTRNRQSVSGRLNVQRGRLTLFSGSAFNLFRQSSTMYDLRRNLVTEPITSIEQNNASDNRSQGWNLDWTAELNVGEGATLWSSAWMYHSGGSRDGVTEYGIFESDDIVRERYDRRNASDFGWGSRNFGLGFKKVFEPQRHELTIDGRLTRGANDNDTENTRIFHVLSGESVEMPDELTLNEIDAGTGNLSLQLDYFRPLAGARLDVGYRAYQRSQDNDNRLRIFDAPDAPEPSGGSHSGYDYRETFHSFYGTLQHTIGRFGAQAGLRAELSATRFESALDEAGFERDYNTLFPSFNVSFSPSQGRTIRLLYAKRIGRPPPFYLDPYVPPTDPLNRSFGNPDLRPSYTQSVTLDMSVNGQRGTLRVAPYLRHTTDVWERIRTVDEEGVATSRWENAATARAYGSNFTISLRPVGRLSGSTRFSVYRDVRDGTNLSSDYATAAWMWSAGGNVGVRLRESLTVQVSGNHFPMQSILQGRASGYTFTTMALRQQILDGKGTLSLNVSDPLNLNRYTSSSSDATFVQTSRSSFDSRVMTLGFTWNFGRPPQRQSRPTGGGEAPAGEPIRVP